jgi:hypothetical protein
VARNAAPVLRDASNQEQYENQDLFLLRARTLGPSARPLASVFKSKLKRIIEKDLERLMRLACRF